MEPHAELFKINYEEFGLPNPEKTLKREFTWVTKNVFPHWKEWREWKIELHHTLHDYYGICSFKDKTITIHNHLLWEDEEGNLLHPASLRATLIHEICHALCPPWHGHSQQWLDAMDEALQLVNEIEETQGDREVFGAAYKNLPYYSDAHEDEQLEEFDSMSEAIALDCFAYGLATQNSAFLVNH